MGEIWTLPISPITYGVVAFVLMVVFRFLTEIDYEPNENFSGWYPVLFLLCVVWYPVFMTIICVIMFGIFIGLPLLIIYKVVQLVVYLIKKLIEVFK